MTTSIDISGDLFRSTKILPSHCLPIATVCTVSVLICANNKLNSTATVRTAIRLRESMDKDYAVVWADKRGYAFKNQKNGDGRTIRIGESGRLVKSVGF